MKYIFRKLNRIKILLVVLNILIIVCSFLCLLFNINIFTLRYEFNGDYLFFIMVPRIFPIKLTYSSLEILIFYLLSLVPIINLILSLIKQFQLYRYILTSFMSLITIISCILMFFFPKILILNPKIHSIKFNNGEFYFDIIHIGGVIAITLSILLTFNTLIFIFNDSRNWKIRGDIESQTKITHAIIKNGSYQRKNLLTCPYCRSKVKIEDYYCMFCNGIIFMNSIVYKLKTLTGECY